MFAFTLIVFVCFSLVVERRQHLMMATAAENAKKAARTEQDLNEFFSHELQNPLAAAMSACSFVWSSIEAEASNNLRQNAQLKKSMLEDLKVIDTSLSFVNEFMESMLEINQASSKCLQLKISPTKLSKSVLEPICRMLFTRNSSFNVYFESPEDLVVLTDAMRLKQVLLNLGVDASKFVKEGFIRYRSVVKKGFVEIYVEDSGPGIPVEKRGNVFNKYESRLDQISQGVGVGLSLSRALIKSMDWDIWLDDSYHSGVQNFPGARYVIRLKEPPLYTEHGSQSTELDVQIPEGIAC